MKPLWLVSGPPDEKGWIQLRADHESEVVDVLHLDPGRWALVHADAAPEGYEGLTARVPTDGMYLDPHGRPCYVLGAREVHSARAVLAGLDDSARELLDRMGDPDMVLERLGRAF